MSKNEVQLDSVSRGMQRYADDPQSFFVDILGLPQEHIWPKMSEMMLSVRDNRRTAIKAGHSVSKSYTMGRLVIWYLMTHFPSTVVTTAPTNRQVEDILWREIREAHQAAKCKLPGHLTRTSIDMQKEHGVKWFATGFATKPDTVTEQATAFQGYHNRHCLVIFDEAAGVIPQIWKAAMSLVADGDGKMVVIGNPTAAYGDFPDCFREGSGWSNITISAHDTPNYKENKQVIPGLAGREYERDIITKYGEGSNEHRIRVLGQFPDFTEGTYYGRWLATAKKEGRIGHVPMDTGSKVYTFWDIGDIYTAIWFVQFTAMDIKIIDYYEDNQGLGLPEYVRMLEAKGYIYGEHFYPWDVEGPNRKSFQTGQTTRDVAAGLGIKFQVVEMHRVEDGIEAARGILNKCMFDKVKCKSGIDALANYRKKKNEALSTDDRPVYHQQPLHDWASHGADSFRYLSMAYRYNRIAGTLLGYQGAKPEWSEYDENGSDINLLEVI